MARADEAVEKLKKRLKVSVLLFSVFHFLTYGVLQDAPRMISITFDTWMSAALDPYLAITAHYISAPPEKPLDWTLESDIIAFTHFKGRHSGANMAQVIMRVVDQYGFRSKVSLEAMFILLQSHTLSSLGGQPPTMHRIMIKPCALSRTCWGMIWMLLPQLVGIA
ncbi:MAG: hypothetical protein ACREHG_09580 [Candidatus Saccharimonadales bacterium]